jgi:hypothetical protein
MYSRPLGMPSRHNFPNIASKLHVFIQELNQYGTAATALLLETGGNGANHFDATGFQRGRALR